MITSNQNSKNTQMIKTANNAVIKNNQRINELKKKINEFKKDINEKRNEFEKYISEKKNIISKLNERKNKAIQNEQRHKGVIKILKSQGLKSNRKYMSLNATRAKSSSLNPYDLKPYGLKSNGQYMSINATRANSNATRANSNATRANPSGPKLYGQYGQNNKKATSNIIKPLYGGKKKQGGRKLHKGPQGGKYYIRNNRKVYV